MSRSLVCSMVMLFTFSGVQAAPPAWWALRGATDGNVPDNHRVVTQGQLKHFTQKAVIEMNAQLHGGAGAELNNLVNGWELEYSNGNHGANNPLPADYHAVTAGQLKWVAVKVYSRLQTVNLRDQLPAWIWTGASTNDQLVNISQLKAVFNFDFDLDSDGLPDWWEQAIIGNIYPPSSLTIENIHPGDDFDGDGVTNLQEYQLGLNPYQKDSDGDGYPDYLSLDLELHLKLDESAGTDAEDTSGKSRNATLVSGASWEATGGIENGGLKINGASEAAVLPAVVLNGASDFTMSLWFKTASTPVVQTLVSAAGVSQSPELAIEIESGTTIRFNVGSGSASWNAGRILADGLWHHLVLVRKSGTGQAFLHLDGAIFGSAQSISPNVLSVSALVLGQRHESISTYDSSRAFSGLLDDVRVWSKALEMTQPADLFLPNDLDRDGLPDDWENSFFGNLSTLAAADDDLDGDGASNRVELNSGTAPGDYYNGTPPVVTLISGSGQTIFNRERTRDPLVFQVTDGTNPLANAPVSLSHLELIGGIQTLDGADFASTMTLRTDSEGKVAVHFKAD